MSPYIDLRKIAKPPKVSNWRNGCPPPKRTFVLSNIVHITARLGVLLNKNQQDALYQQPQQTFNPCSTALVCCRIPSLYNSVPLSTHSFIHHYNKIVVAWRKALQFLSWAATTGPSTNSLTMRVPRTARQRGIK
jgi:hypothetical protein